MRTRALIPFAAAGFVACAQGEGVAPGNGSFGDGGGGGVAGLDAAREGGAGGGGGVGASAGAHSGGNAGTGASGGASAGSANAGGAAGDDASAGSGGTAGASAGGSTSSGGAAGAPGCTPGTNCVCTTYANHAYQLCKSLKTWTNAEADCEAHGMRLVRLDDAAENTWAYKSANGLVMLDPWIGGTASAAANQWRWADGELFWIGLSSGAAQNGLYDDWNIARPLGLQCASYDLGERWADRLCTDLRAYVCEQY